MACCTWMPVPWHAMRISGVCSPCLASCADMFLAVCQVSLTACQCIVTKFTVKCMYMHSHMCLCFFSSTLCQQPWTTQHVKWELKSCTAQSQTESHKQMSTDSKGHPASQSIVNPCLQDNRQVVVGEPITGRIPCNKPPPKQNLLGSTCLTVGSHTQALALRPSARGDGFAADSSGYHAPKRHPCLTLASCSAEAALQLLQAAPCERSAMQQLQHSLQVNTPTDLACTWCCLPAPALLRHITLPIQIKSSAATRGPQHPPLHPLKHHNSFKLQMTDAP